MITARELAAYVLLASFLALLLSSGATDGPVQVWRAMRGEGEDPHNLLGLSTKPGLCLDRLKGLAVKNLTLERSSTRLQSVSVAENSESQRVSIRYVNFLL